MRAALGAIRATRLLDRRPLWAVTRWLVLQARHGVTLYTVAAWSASRFPDAPAVVDAEGPVTFRDLLGRADRIAGALAQRVAPGATVGLLGRNRAAFVAVLLATQRLGRRVVLLNTSWSAHEIAEAARTHGVGLLLSDDEFLPELRASAPDLAVWPTSDVLESGRGELPRHRPGRGGSLVILSSGSTGPPRAIRRRPRPADVLPTLTALLGALDVRAHAPTLLTIPLFHGHGLATLGLSLAMAAPLHLRAYGTPEAFWAILDDADIEVLVLVPTVLHRLLAMESSGTANRLRTIVCGSAPLPPDLALRALARFGPVLYDLYGSTEGGLISLATPAQLLRAPDSVGTVLPGVHVTIRRHDGTPAAPGETGEVVVTGRLTVGPRDRDGGLRTGDLGSLDATGLLRLAGRRDDLLVCGGENVSPEAVEARIGRLEYVRECAVVGVPSEEYGQSLAAFIVLERHAVGVTPERVARDLQTLLPRFLRPTRLSFVDALPRNALGKLMRHRLLTSDVTCGLPGQGQTPRTRSR